MKIRRFLFPVLLLCLLFTAPLHAQAQDEEEQPPSNKAWLKLYVDQHGGAKVSLTLHVPVSDDELLKRTLAESFSFPLQFKPIERGEPESDELESDLANEETSDHDWTVISAGSPSAFSHNRLESNCRINLESLITFLRSQNVDYLNVWAMFRNAPDDIPVQGANRLSVLGTYVDTYEADIDVRAPAFQIVSFKMGYSVADVLKRTIPLLAFLLLPSLWTFRSSRRLVHRPEELWGRHLRFITRLLNVIWLIWLPIYSLSGVDSLISFACGAEADLAQLVNLTFYFVPPMFALLLCHLASRRVYALMPAIEFSPSDIVLHAITATAFSLTPLFLLFLAINTFRTNPRQAALYVVIGYVGWLILRHALSKQFDPTPYSLADGDLRDRIYELANKAGVLLKDVYLIPEDRAPLSNAFARSDDTVCVTLSLLKNLSRREVDDVMAHEIGHLQARHPHTGRTIALTIIIVANVLGSALAWTMNLRYSTAVVFSGALALSSLVKFFIWRRKEAQADSIGVSLTGDPEAFISGLARLSRLNLQPLHSGVLGASLDSHPRTMSRLESIAKSHGISAERMQELIADANTPPDNLYPTTETEEVEPVVFHYAFKKKNRLRIALLLLGVMLLAPVPFAMLFTASTGLLRLAVFVAAVVCCFGLFQLVRNKIAVLGQRRLSCQFRAKLEKRGLGDLAQPATLVGLAPAAESRNFENYPFWDLGALWSTDDKLYFVGEQIEFALAREEVENIFAQDANPEWLPQKNLFVEWRKADEGEKQTLHFVVVGERSVRRARRATDLLRERLDQWRHRTTDFPSAPPNLESLEAPVFPEITSAPTITEFHTARIFAAALQLACYGAVVGFALRLSVPGLLFVAGVVFVGTFLDEFPKYLRKRKVTVKDRFEPANYQRGSWADSEASGS